MFDITSDVNYFFSSRIGFVNLPLSLRIFNICDSIKTEMMVGMI